MFKKASDVKALQRLSGADRKKLRRSIRERFSQASDADLDLILPPKAEVSVARLTNRAYVYAVEGGPPMLFDIDGRGNEIFPTVYALWKAPSLLPAFVLKGGEVSRYVLGGADLMFPGIYIPPEGLSLFVAGEPWAVKVPGNAAPIAVGVTLLSSADAIKAGLRGKALRITHYYRDTLWESAEGRYIPNAGFLEDMVTRDPACLSAELGETVEDEDASGSDDVDHDIDVENTQEELKGTSSPSEAMGVGVKDGMTTEAVAVSKDVEALASKVECVEVNDGGDGEGESMDVPVTPDEVDSLLDQCLLQALHTTVKEKDLPMPGSTLWSNHILSCRPPGKTLDLKKSSHKKLSKWLQSKATTGLISAKEDKHRKEVMLLGFNRSHPEFLSFKPVKKVISQETNPIPSPSVVQQAPTGKLDVSEVWKCSSHVRPIFEAVSADAGGFYSFSEASEVAFSYVDKESLVKPDNKSLVVLDALLCDALYKGTIKKGSTYPTEIHKKDLGSTFVSRMQPHHRVVRGNESAIRKGALKSVQIMTERRQGSKKVTRVSGMESFLVDPEHLANELQKKFACSTSVAELPGKKGQYEVLVQGGVIEDLGRHLVQQYDIPKKYIEILDKTKR